MELEVIYFGAEWESGTTGENGKGMRYTHQVTAERSREMLTGDTIEVIFDKFYAKNNQLKYCNGCYYKFAEEVHEGNYSKWLDGVFDVEFYMKHGGDMY